MAPVTTTTMCETPAPVAMDAGTREVRVSEVRDWAYPATPFEEYMQRDDRPSHTMSFCIELLLEGELQRDAFFSALEGAISRHPLLNSVLTRRWLGQSVWKPAEIPPQIEWVEAESPPRLPTPPFQDITQEAGLRVWALAIPQTPRIVFQFHHAAVDGVGALEFIGDWLALYGQQTTPAGEEEPELADIAQESLKTRGNLGAESCRVRDWLPAFLSLTWENLSSFGVPLARRREPQQREPVEEIGFPPYLTRILEADELASIKQAAARWGVMPNEIYTSVMIQTLQRWNLRQFPKQRGWVRMGMPVSLRTPLQEGCPAANQVSMLLLNRRLEQLDDFGSTLKFVHKFCHKMIGGVGAPTFVRNLAWMRYVPGMLWLMTRLPVSFSTGVFANVGDVKRQFRGRFPLVKGRIRAGSVIMDGLLGAAPIRPRTGVATSVGTYGRRLFINMNYDRGILTRGDAEEILDLFVAGLREVVGSTVTTPITD